MPAVVVLTTAPNLKIAKPIARALITEKLAACVSLNKEWFSFYRWKGRIASNREVLLLIKTSKKNFIKVKRFIQAHHPYDLPEVIAIPIVQGSPEYLRWLFDATARPKGS